jgi:hypothetical protein
MAEDITILEQYLTHRPTEAQLRAKPYSTVPTTSGGPVVYLTVPRKRKGLETSADPGGTQREIIEQVLSPFATEVRKLYFETLHPCFPILDEETFLDMWQKDNQRISSVLLCDLYASALPFWRTSESLSTHPRPDLNFVWNLAVKALQDDFLGPTISTVHAALLDMAGRPVGAVTGNIVNAGRVGTLAQSLGLHRDPTSWTATTHEKNVRIRLWWGIVIHDHWSSISHGIPPTIHPEYYDVPLVSIDMFNSLTKSPAYLQSISTFIHLCTLTQILGAILPLIYALRLSTEETFRRLRKVECSLDDWLVSLPTYLSLNSSTTVNGRSNLHFSYLSTKLLLSRLSLKATLKSPTVAPEARLYRLSLLRQASLDVIEFVTVLKDEQLQEFWLPYTSYLLVTAATILLRCTIECNDLGIKRACIAKLVAFRERLERARDEVEWDLAEFCLERCGEHIGRFADALSGSAQGVRGCAEATSAQNGVEVEDRVGDEPVEEGGDLGDFFLTMDSLQNPWGLGWDAFDGSWHT